MKDILKRYFFRKNERLRRKKYIDELFTRGTSFFSHPFKVIFLGHDHTDVDGHQLLVSVSRRVFKRAVDRNKIKRRIREAYRLNKHTLGGIDHPKLFIAYIYVGKEIHDYEFIAGKLIESLERLKGMVIAVD